MAYRRTTAGAYQYESRATSIQLYEEIISSYRIPTAADSMSMLSYFRQKNTICIAFLTQMLVLTGDA